MPTVSKKVIAFIFTISCIVIMAFLSLTDGQNLSNGRIILTVIAKWGILIGLYFFILQKEKIATPESIIARYNAFVVAFVTVISILMGLLLSFTVNPDFKISGSDIYLIILIGGIAFIGKLYASKVFPKKKEY